MIPPENSSWKGVIRVLTVELQLVPLLPGPESNVVIQPNLKSTDINKNPLLFDTIQ